MHRSVRAGNLQTVLSTDQEFAGPATDVGSGHSMRRHCACAGQGQLRLAIPPVDIDLVGFMTSLGVGVAYEGAAGRPITLSLSAL